MMVTVPFGRSQMVGLLIIVILILLAIVLLKKVI